MKKINFLAVIMVCLITACTDGIEKSDPTLFELVSSEETGISFTNQLAFNNDFNVYTYRNFYNGGGVSVGDINNDNLVDIYFTSNLETNRLYLNQGDFKFKDITEESKAGGTKAWSTGVTMVDINADGLLDIYVCNSGDVAGDNKQNELFINNGDLTFTEAASQYNLADKGYSTHASFFDYDKDGDLDVYILNNSYQAIGSFNLRKNERPKRDALGGDKLMRNDDGVFTDVSEEAGIYGSVIGFGLGVTVGDVNNDGWEDIYVSNDFFERDYLYINQQNGKFTEELVDQINSVSAASMGADMADINNDGYNDIFVTEMLPSTNSRLKTVTTFDSWDRYQYSVENDYYHQFTRNMLQLNNGNNTFSEVGRMAGVEASDWSWGALLFDMNNDGLRDLYIANGIYKDLTDQDYLQYISNEEVVKSIVVDNKVNYAKLIDTIPSNPIPNLTFENLGDLQFNDASKKFGLDKPSFSNGGAYGDFDNDGDLDLVVNNINMESFVYKNTTDTTGNYIKLILQGQGKNKFGVGAKIRVSSGDEIYYTEQQPTRGFQSSVDFRPNIGLKNSEPLEILVTWPSGMISLLSDVQVNQTIVVKESDAQEQMDQTTLPNVASIFKPVNASIDHLHQENTYIDFDRERMLYHMKSSEGPKVSNGDINGDQVPDFYVGGSKGYAGALWVSIPGGTYQSLQQELFETDRVSEDGESIFFDADGDGDLDLYVCSGGIEFSRSSSALADRLYINDQGAFTKSPQKLPIAGKYVSSSSVSSYDYDQDGDLDLVVGERLSPFNYGVKTSCYVLANDGKGNFQDVTDDIAPELSEIGMITDVQFANLDEEEDHEIVVVGEYTGVHIFKLTNGKYVDSTPVALAEMKGWWKSLYIADLNGDGMAEILVGNQGTNSRFKASVDQPLRLYVGDFDKNGSIDPILTGYANDGKSYPFALRHNLIDQIKQLKKKFPDYKSYENATIETILDEEALSSSEVLEANTLSTVLLKNNGGLSFERISLPYQVQLSPTYAITSHDFDGDGDIDILLGGNLHKAKPEVGRYDASYGLYLENNGGLNFSAKSNNSGFIVYGEIRDLLVVGNSVYVSRNSDSILEFTF